MKNIFKIFIPVFVVLAAFSVSAYNEKISTCPNGICTAITDDLPNGAIGVDPNIKVTLGMGVYKKTDQKAPACEGTRKLFHVVRRFENGTPLYQDMTKNSYDYLNPGAGNLIESFEFNSGKTGQRNRYQGVFYCWTSSQGTNRGTLDLLLGNLGTQNQTWSTPLFDQTAKNVPTPKPAAAGTSSTTKTTVKTNEKKTSLDFPNPLRSSDLNQMLKSIGSWVFYLAIPVAVAVIVISGIMMMASQGDPGKFGTAKKMLLWAVAGLVVLFIGEGFTKLIESIINLKNR